MRSQTWLIRAGEVAEIDLLCACLHPSGDAVAALSFGLTSVDHTRCSPPGTIFLISACAQHYQGPAYVTPPRLERYTTVARK